MMRAFRRLLALAGVMSLVVIPTSLPALAQSGAPSSITHRQSVLTELSPTGEPGASRIFTQLTVEGDGDVQVVLPNQSTSGLRNLNGFGRPSTSGDDVVWDIAATRDGVQRRTVADNTAEQPVAIEVAYELDGESIAPKDLLGRSGVVTVTYTVRNLTSIPQDIRFFDGQGRPSVETLDVAVPMVGSLSTTLDGRFVDVRAPGAAVAGDGRGNTVVNWSLLLFAPLGSEEAVLSYTAHVSDAIVAPANAQILPVDSRSFNSLRSAQDSFKGVNSGLKDLTSGALIVDGNVKLLASGAAQLLDGLEQLRDGAEALNEGLAESAAPGSQELSDGLGQARSGGRELANGLGDLESGARQLANGLGSARAGGGELASGLGDLESGARQLANGLGSARAGGGDLAEGLGALEQGAGELSAGMGTAVLGGAEIRGGLQGLIAGAIGEEDDLPPDDITLLGGLNGLIAGLQSQIGPGTGALKALSEGLADSFGPDPAAGGANAGQKAAGAAAGVGGVRDVLVAIAAQDGQIPGIDHLDADALVCLDATEPAALGFPPPGCINESVFDAIADGLVPDSFPDSDEAKTFLSDLGVEPAELEDQKLVPLNLLLNEQLVPGLTQVEAGLSGQAASLGLVWPDCATAVSTAQAFAAGEGPAPTGLEVIQAVSCISASVDGGINGLVIPGLIDVRNGMSNAGAFDTTSPSYNPACLRPGDEGYNSVMAPCGLKQGLQLVHGGLGDLNTGLARLDDGATRLSAGATAAEAGSRALLGGLVQLDDGAGQLAAGAGRAASGSSDLADGLRQLDDGAGQLADGAGRAASGSNDLANGLVQLDDGAAQLAAGLGDAADGSGQIAEGLVSAADGGGQIADGTVRLSEAGMGSIIDGASAGAAGPSQLLELAKAVDSRGRAGEGLPYATADGAVASAVFSYEIAGLGSDEGPGFLGLLTAALIGLAAAGSLAFVGMRRRGI